MGTPKEKPKLSPDNAITNVTGALRRGKICKETLFVEINGNQFKNYKIVEKDEEESFKAGWRAGLQELMKRGRLCSVCKIDAKRVQEIAKKKKKRRVEKCQSVEVRIVIPD